MKVSKLPEGTVTTRWLDSKTMEITYAGQLTPPLIDLMFRDFWDVAGGRTPMYALFDTSQMRGFSANIRSTALRFMSEFKMRGGREILGIVPLGTMRMFGQAAAFATGISLRLFAKREEAIQYVVSKITEL